MLAQEKHVLEVKWRRLLSPPMGTWLWGTCVVPPFSAPRICLWKEELAGAVSIVTGGHTVLLPALKARAAAGRVQR